MIIEPAIDLKDGRVVRLVKGDFRTVHQVAEDPILTAREFVAAGARYVHMVDLDGANSGQRLRVNVDIVRRVADETGLLIELGGGIRCMDDLKAVFDMGVYRAVIGSAAVTDPAFVSQAVGMYGDRIAVGIDARFGYVRTDGWMKDSRLHYLDLAQSMEEIGVQTLIYTDIETDGTLSGPPFENLRALSDRVSCNVIASGGITGMNEVKKLASMNLYGCIIGMGYYAGTIDLAEAVEIGGEQ